MKKERTRLGGVLFLPLSSTDEEEEEEEEKEEEEEVKIHEYCESLRKQLRGDGGEKVADPDIPVDVLLMRDLVQFTPPPDPTGDGGRGSRGRRATGAGWVLAVKIAGAVTEMAYSFQDVRRVAALVVRNVGSVRSSTSSFASARVVDNNALLRDQVREMLARLLKPSDNGSGEGMPALHVNSNEPVLLVNTHGVYTGPEISALLYQAIAQLHTDYGVKPVRVYAGEYIPTPILGGAREAGENSKGFSISILNVVNTEIGGPSMIQCLDWPSGAAGWKVSVSKEEWEGCDGCLGGMVELGLRNWDAGLQSTDLEDTGEGIGGDGGEQVEALEQEAGEMDHVLRSEVQEQYVTVDEPADIKGWEISAAQGERADEDAPEMEIAREREQGQDRLPALGSSNAEEIEAGTDATDDVNEFEEKVLETERKEARDREAGQSKENDEHLGTTMEVVDRPSALSEEDFEMVDRERTLIDMVFGHGKRT